MPVVDLNPVPREVADIVEQLFCIAFVEDLTPTADDRYAAILRSIARSVWM